MGMNTVFDGNDPVLVDKMLGSSYEVVRLVAKNIEYIKHVSANLAEVYRVAGSADGIDTLVNQITLLESIQAQLTALLTIGDNLPAITALNTNLAVLQSIFEKLPDLADLNAAVDSLSVLLPYTAEITAVGTSINAITAINAKLTVLQYINDNMATLLANTETLDSIDSRVTALEEHTDVVDTTTFNNALNGKTNVSTTDALTARVATAEQNIATNVQGLTDANTAIGTKAPLSHTHTIAQVTGLQGALDAKQVAGSYASINGNASYNFSSNYSYANNFYVNGSGWLTDLLAAKQPAGYYQAAGTYVQDVRLGAQTWGSGGAAPSGCVWTTLVGSDPGTGTVNFSNSYYKPIQRMINGSWATVTG